MATLDQDDLDAIEALIVANNAAVADAVWDETLTGASHNTATSAGRRLRTLADTVILKDGDTVAADNAGTINGENSLGRIKLQPDVGTVEGEKPRVEVAVVGDDVFVAELQTVDFSGRCRTEQDQFAHVGKQSPRLQRFERQPHAPIETTLRCALATRE